VKRGDGLWNLMPFNTRIALEHQYGGLTTAIETQLVADKDHVSANKGEFTTPAYALLNLRGAYEWSNLRFDLGVDNITNALYSLPLGGFDLTNYSRNAVLFGRNVGLASVRQVPGMGRNFYAGLTVKF
jgi:iron complex outermembrane receptor protein